MKEITAHIESNGKDLFSVYYEEDLPFGFIGEGNTIEEAKEDFLNTFEAMRQAHKEETGEWVEYTFRFQIEISAFLQKYKGLITLAALSRLTGINQMQLSQYACGTRTPLPKTREKIAQAVTAFGEELSRLFVNP